MNQIKTEILFVLLLGSMDLGHTSNETRKEGNIPGVNSQDRRYPNFKAGASKERNLEQLGPVETGNITDETNYAVVFNKGYRRFAGIRLLGRTAVLQAPQSSVKLYAPEGLDGFVYGHMHTDPAPFLYAIPESECLVSPVVDYHMFIKECIRPDKSFKIFVPHCINNAKDLKHIKVRCGDIHRNVPFSELSSDDFDVNITHITIHTKHFSQFICTSCNNVCRAEANALIFGSMSPMWHTPTTAALRLYIASTLYTTQDFKKVFETITFRALANNKEAKN